MEEKKERNPIKYLSRNIRSICFAIWVVVVDLGVNISLGDLSFPQQRTCNSPMLGTHNTITHSPSFLHFCLYGYCLLLLPSSRILFCLCFVIPMPQEIWPNCISWSFSSLGQNYGVSQKWLSLLECRFSGHITSWLLVEKTSGFCSLASKWELGVQGT